MTSFVNDDDVLVVGLLDQRLDAARAPAVKQSLVSNITDQPRRVLIDAQAVEFMDSTGLGVLVSLLKMMGEGGRIAVAGANPSVRRLFEITKLDSVFMMVADKEAGLIALNA